MPGRKKPFANWPSVCGNLLGHPDELPSTRKVVGVIALLLVLTIIAFQFAG